MNVKAFCAILGQVAELQNASGQVAIADSLGTVIARLKRHNSKPLPQFFIVRSANREISQASEEALSASMLGKIVRHTSGLLRAAGSNAKAGELANVANDLEALGEQSATSVVDAIEADERKAIADQIETYASQLAAAERNGERFDAIVQEIGKLNAQIAIQIAVTYVQGRANYGSKPKALAAIRNKQYAQERFRDKIGQ